MQHLFSDHVEAFELTERGFTVSFQFYISVLKTFSLSRYRVRLQTTVSLSYLGYYTYSSRNIKNALASISFIDSLSIQRTDRSRKVACLRNSQWTRLLTALDTRIYTAREYRFRRPATLPTVSETPCLKGGNDSNSRKIWRISASVNCKEIYIYVYIYQRSF